MAKVVCSMAYDTQFSIYDHDIDVDDNPLALVTKHNSEEYQAKSGLYALINRFKKQNVAERLGLSLSEYLELPIYVINMITDQFTDEASEHARVREELERHEGNNSDNDKAMQPLR